MALITFVYSVDSSKNNNNSNKTRKPVQIQSVGKYTLYLLAERATQSVTVQRT